MEYEYTNDDLAALRRCLLYIMKDVDRVCKENGIHYFIMFGTLIGAVRHKGFIPWDDDMDICMMRSDYERFMQIADEKLREDLFVENYKNTKGYGNTFGKVMLRGTVWKEDFTERVDCHKNVYIDVLPVDRTYADQWKFTWNSIKELVLHKMLLLNCDYKYTKTGIKKLIYSFGYWFSKRWKKETIIRFWEKTAIKDPKIKKGKNIVYLGSFPIGWGTFLDDEMNEFIELPFEDMYLEAPKEYDSILRRLYGDYTILPPKEKQISHHGIVELDFGRFKAPLYDSEN